MRFLTVLQTAILISLAWLGTASAASVWTDIYDPADTLLTSGASKHVFTHDILDNGFDPLQYTITRAQLTVQVKDDAAGDVGGELPGNR